MSEGFLCVAERSALARNAAISRSVGAYEVAIFDCDGELFALENACPHQGGPLVEGSVEQGVVTCPWHAWRFDLRTGCMTLGDFARVARFAVRIDEGRIWLSKEPIEE
uniref:Putative Assimilatory nitrite reductase (NAD(P)H) small subunit n=1 Tax=mine drainage metagenome TaxID=410659 RepID=E6PD17_9ZZZZ